MSDAAARIPQELFDNIIDSISSKSDLSSCTLVSRSWLARSRRNLFARVKLRDKGVQNQFHFFLAFLNASNNSSLLLGPPISGLVQYVCVRNDQPLTIVEIINTDMLRSLLSLLPNLRDLEFLGITLSWVAPEIVDPPKDRPTFCPIHLDNLNLLGTTTASKTPLDIVASLCLFSSIKVLQISFLDFEDHEFSQHPTAISTHPSLSAEEPYFPSRLRVSSIKFPDYSHTPFLLALIAKTASVETITDVNVACRTSDQVRALGSFLGVVGPKIKQITVDIVISSSINTASELTSFGLLQSSNLSACTTLTNLSVRMALFAYRKELNTAAFTAATTLLSMTPTTVQTVTLEIELNGLVHFRGYWDNYLHWIRKNAASQLTDFQSTIKRREGVRRLCIRWCNMPWDRLDESVIEGMDLFVRAQLSELDAKGILYLERN